jgi:hypothetical protein
MKKKSAFILYDKEADNEGMKMLYRVLVEDKKFESDVLRTLIMRYPYILSKNEE